MKRIKYFFLHDGSAKHVLNYYLLTRILLLIIGYLTINEFRLHGIEKNPTWIYHSSIWLNMWGTWDTGWYLDIAKNWYPDIRTLSNADCGQCNFFPFYPALMSGLNFLTGLDYFIAGIMISNLALLFSGILLYKIVLLLYDEIKAKNAALFLFLFPTSFILSGVFTESLYLFLILLSIFSALKGKWALGGLCAFFLSLTRSVGVFVFLPLLIEYLSQKNYRIKNIKADILFLLFIPAGASLFLIQNYFSTGDPFYFFHNPHWQYKPLNPFYNLIEGMVNPYFTFRFESIYCLIVIIFCFISFKTVPLSFNVINFYSLFIPLSYGVISMPRMSLVSFPIFIQLAFAAQKLNARTSIIIILAMFQIYLAVCWFLGFGNVV